MAAWNQREHQRSAPPILPQRHRPPQTLTQATSTLSLQHSTADPAKPSAGGLQPRPSTNTYTPSNKAVLQRPLEPGQYLSIRYTNRLHHRSRHRTSCRLGRAQSLTTTPSRSPSSACTRQNSSTNALRGRTSTSRVRHPRTSTGSTTGGFSNPSETSHQQKRRPTTIEAAGTSPASWTQVKHSPGTRYGSGEVSTTLRVRSSLPVHPPARRRPPTRILPTRVNKLGRTIACWTPRSPTGTSRRNQWTHRSSQQPDQTNQTSSLRVTQLRELPNPGPPICGETQLGPPRIGLPTEIR